MDRLDVAGFRIRGHIDVEFLLALRPEIGHFRFDAHAGRRLHGSGFGFHPRSGSPVSPGARLLAIESGWRQEQKEQA